MPKPALTARQLELRAKLHNRCEAVKRQNQTRTMLKCGKGGMIINVDANDMPINCRSRGRTLDTTMITFEELNAREIYPYKIGN